MIRWNYENSSVSPEIYSIFTFISLVHWPEIYKSTLIETNNTLVALKIYQGYVQLHKYILKSELSPHIYTRRSSISPMTVCATESILALCYGILPFENSAMRN